jgi:hypothetical protein
MPESSWDGPFKLEAEPHDYSKLYDQAARLLVASTTGHSSFDGLTVTAAPDQTEVEFKTGPASFSRVMRIARGTETDELKLSHQQSVSGISEQYIETHECTLRPDSAEERVASQHYLYGIGNQSPIMTSEPQLPTLAHSVDRWSATMRSIASEQIEHPRRRGFKNRFHS